jgi:hypothetical protein
MAEFLDGEHDTGERGVECCGDAGCAARQHQCALQFVTRQVQQAPEPVHDRCADLHRRSLAADRGAAAQAQQCQSDLAGGDARRQHAGDRRAVGHVLRRDHLGDAAALGARKDVARQQE